MARIHFLVKEVSKIQYQAQARREGKSLGQWLREAADEKLEAGRSRKLFTPEELEEFFKKCNDLHEPGGREPDWEETKELLLRTRYPNYDV